MCIKLAKIVYCRNIKQTKWKSSKKPRENFEFFCGFGLSRNSSRLFYHRLKRKSISAFHKLSSWVYRRTKNISWSCKTFISFPFPEVSNFFVLKTHASCLNFCKIVFDSWMGYYWYVMKWASPVFFIDNVFRFEDFSYQILLFVETFFPFPFRTQLRLDPSKIPFKGKMDRKALLKYFGHAMFFKKNKK